jgi:hypothetical protein
MRPITTFIRRVVVGALGLALGLAAYSAMADVVTVVSSKSPITTLSKNQVADIFFGREVDFPMAHRRCPSIKRKAQSSASSSTQSWLANPMHK